MAIVVGVVAAVLAGSLLVGADTSFEPALTLMSERCLDSSDVAVVFLDSTATGAEPGVESILARTQMSEYSGTSKPPCNR
jgi:hypothetical protein